MVFGRIDCSDSVSKVSAFSESQTGSYSYSGGQHDHDSDDSSTEQLERSFAPKHVLVGRDNEVHQLQDAFGRVATPGAASEAVLIGGSSGSGKTSLIETSLRTQVAKSNGFFVAAKCEQVRTHVPFPALASVLSDLCDLLAQEEQSLPAIRARVTKAVAHVGKQ